MAVNADEKRRADNRIYSERTAGEWVEAIRGFNPAAAVVFDGFTEDELDRVFAWLVPFGANDIYDEYSSVVSPIRMIHTLTVLPPVKKAGLARRIKWKLSPLGSIDAMEYSEDRGYRDSVQSSVEDTLGYLARYADSDSRYLAILFLAGNGVSKTIEANAGYIGALALKHSMREVFLSIIDDVPFNLISQHLTHGIDASILNSMVDAA